LFYMGFLIACDMCPSLVSNHNLDCANALMHGIWAWRMMTMAASPYEGVYEWNKYWMLVLRFWQGLMFGNARLSILLNGCVVAVDCLVCAYFLPPGIRLYISRELSVFGATSCMMWTFQHIQLAEAKALVSLQNMDTAATLVRGLLDSICDAVVKLDHELRLTETCPALSTMLLRDGPLAPGMLLTDLLVPDDGERFRSCLSAPSVSGLGEVGQRSDRAFAGLCHVKLKHRFGSVLPVNLFFSSMALATGQVSYLIGIQEIREEGHHDVPDSVDYGLGGTLSDVGAGQDWLPALPEGSIRLMSHRSRSSFSGSESCINEADIHVWVDATSPTLTVLDCSSDFALLAVAGPGGTCRAMSEWLSSSHLRAVQRLVRQRGPSRVNVRLIPDKAWSYKCALSIDSVQTMRTAAPLSSQPVCLVIDSLVCKISKPTTIKVAPTYDLELWTAVDNRCMSRITHARGDCKQLADAFLANPNLESWMPAAMDFFRALLPILEDLDAGKSNVLPRMMGMFTFRNPGQRPSSWHFKANMTFIDDGGRNDKDPLYHFGLKMASEQGQVQL